MNPLPPLFPGIDLLDSDDEITSNIASFEPQTPIRMLSPSPEGSNRSDYLLPYEDEDPDAFIQHPPPPPRTYQSREALIEGLNAFYATHGTAMVISNSKLPQRQVILHCIRHGQHKHARTTPSLPLGPAAASYTYPSPSSKAATSIKTGCMYRVYARDGSGKDEDGAWVEGREQKWTFTVTHSEHNHPRIPPLAIALLRRLRPEEKMWLLQHIRLGYSGPKIIRLFKQNFNRIEPIPKDIYNLTYALRRDERAGHTAAEATVAKLEALGEVYRAFKNTEGQLVGLTYTTSTARALATRFPQAFFFDCTYKTNRYRMPMLHMVGFTSCGSTFTAAVVFMFRETTNWYTLALESTFDLLGNLDIKVAFVDREQALHAGLRANLPEIGLIYCLWHLKENIKAHIADTFRGIEGDWQQEMRNFIKAWEVYIVRSRTMEARLEGIGQFKRIYADPLYQNPLRYSLSLLKDKEHFVWEYTDKMTHFGQRSSSAIEGRHHAFKRRLERTKADIYYVVDILRDYFDRQWTDIGVEMSQEMTRKAVNSSPLLAKINGRVSRQAIQLIKLQIQWAQNVLADEKKNTSSISIPCLHTFRSSHGLPCSHDIIPYLRKGLPLELGHFHRHWRLTNSEKLEELRNEVDLRVAQASSNLVTVELDVEDYLDDEERLLDPPKRMPGIEMRAIKAGKAPYRGPVLLNTGRIASQGEVAEGIKPKRRACQDCGITGHTASQCPHTAVQRSLLIQAKKRAKLAQKGLVRGLVL